MVSSILSDDFYQNLKQICQEIETSETKFIVSSIGKQSLGKSYFLKRVFDSRFNTKDCQIVGKGTNCFQCLRLQDFYLFDMEGMESNESVTLRDAFNFFSIITISDVILFHISHRDLEDRDFIQNFAFLFFQCFSPVRSTCYSFRLHMPKIILLIKDPRWENEELKVLIKYQELVQKFQSEVKDHCQRFSEKIVKILEAAEIEHEKNDRKRAEIRENFAKLRDVKIEFKIDEFHPVYFQQIGFGKHKKIEYYKIRQKSGVVQIKPSKFRFLFRSIWLEIQQKANNIKYELPLSQADYDCFKDINGFREVFYMMKAQKEKEEGLVAIVTQIFIDVKNDIFFSYENIDGYENFVSKYYSIKDEVEKIIKNADVKNKPKKPKNCNKILFKKEKNLYFKEIQNKTREAFRNIIKKHNLQDIELKIINYIRLILVKRFNEIFNLHPENKDSILYTTLLAILVFDDKPTIKKQLKTVKNQIKLFRCLWIYDESFIELLTSTFTGTFKYFQTFIELLNENLKLIQEIQSGIKLEDELLPIGKMNSSFTNRKIEKYLSLFSKFSSISVQTYLEFVRKFQKIYTLKLRDILNNQSLITLEKCKKIDVIMIENFIETKSLIYTIFPSISGLMAGIISLVIRAALIAAAETAVAAAAAAATTLWIPIVGWTIFGVTTCISIGWFFYKWYKNKSPVRINENYKAKLSYKIEGIKYLEFLLNGKIKRQEFILKKDGIKINPNKLPNLNRSIELGLKNLMRLNVYDKIEVPVCNEFDFTCTLKKNKDNLYSAFAKIVIVVYLIDPNCNCNHLG